MNRVGQAVLTENLVKRYPVVSGFRELLRHPFKRTYRTALDGVSLGVDKGECFCLLGPNGAGKTTLIKVLTTLMIPDGGRAAVNGFDVEAFPGQVKDSVGYALNDERGFYWRLTARQNLEFFGALNNLRGNSLEMKVRDVLRITNLESAAELRFNAFSTGMRQMLAFARALLTDVEILFVDEPTRSLDPRAADKVRAFLKDELVRGHGRTVFWATHNLNEALDVADKIAVIDRGKIKIMGRVSDLTEEGRLSLPDIYEAALEKAGEAVPASETERDS
jgi:ABC-2 type transport system ATP-binding protein